MKCVQKVLGVLPAAALVVALVLAVASPVAAAKAPTGRTYFIVSIGVATDEGGAYDLSAGCLRFTQTELCSGELDQQDCGTWWIVGGGQARREMAIGYKFDLTDDETGAPITIEGQGRIDTRGPKSAFGGVAHGFDLESGVQINFAIAGRAVAPARCEQLVERFEAQNDN